jgi:hypothetical protein
MGLPWVHRTCMPFKRLPTGIDATAAATTSGTDATLDTASRFALNARSNTSSESDDWSRLSPSSAAFAAVRPRGAALARPRPRGAPLPAPCRRAPTFPTPNATAPSPATSTSSSWRSAPRAEARRLWPTIDTRAPYAGKSAQSSPLLPLVTTLPRDCDTLTLRRRGCASAALPTLLPSLVGAKDARLDVRRPERDALAALLLPALEGTAASCKCDSCDAKASLLFARLETRALLPSRAPDAVERPAVLGPSAAPAGAMARGAAAPSNCCVSTAAAAAAAVTSAR